ncbi:hypothetical protein AVEN_197762-1 [Araneus ventricosus]|uniref:Uncharacterized protein n=1 Tax=Araneus ventricosus TaxID=182803 RepID=A0A4Y2NQW3_ARAVE|nr:hypothetical protein AVEN_197762-1 [Araneus ventricosus]
MHTILGNHMNHPALPWHSGLHERPAVAADNLALWPPHNSHLYEWFMRRPPVLPGYDLSSEIGPKSNTTIKSLAHYGIFRHLGTAVTLLVPGNRFYYPG